MGYFTPQAYCPLWGVKPARSCFSAPSMRVQEGMCPIKSNKAVRVSCGADIVGLMRLFVGYFTPQAYCPLWGVKPARFRFSAPSMGVQDFHLRLRALPCSHFGLTPLSHIGWRCAPLMVYKPLERP